MARISGPLLDRIDPHVDRERRPIPAADPAGIRGLIADLDSDRFLTREKAEEELAKLGTHAEEPLAKVLDGKPDPRYAGGRKGCCGGWSRTACTARAAMVLEYMATARPGRC